MATDRGGADEDTGARRLYWFSRMLGLFPPGALIDLGAGHGMFSVAAADAGWQVTALDARGDRFPEDTRVDWRVGDVRDHELGDYDVVACLGLFYHLTIDDQLDLLARTSGRPMILDTHVANGRPSPFSLSQPQTMRGYRGRLFEEKDLTRSTASWGNTDSFWPSTRALHRMLGEHGYDVLTATPWYLPTRTFFLCLPR